MAFFAYQGGPISTRSRDLVGPGVAPPLLLFSPFSDIWSTTVCPIGYWGNNLCIIWYTTPIKMAVPKRLQYYFLALGHSVCKFLDLYVIPMSSVAQKINLSVSNPVFTWLRWHFQRNHAKSPYALSNPLYVLGRHPVHITLKVLYSI